MEKFQSPYVWNIWSMENFQANLQHFTGEKVSNLISSFNSSEITATVSFKHRYTETTNLKS
jgi:hypothetical protein